MLNNIGRPPVCLSVFVCKSVSLQICTYSGFVIGIRHGHKTYAWAVSVFWRTCFGAKLVKVIWMRPQGQGYRGVGQISIFTGHPPVTQSPTLKIRHINILFTLGLGRMT